MSKTPTPDDLRLAAEWLTAYEEGTAEATRCKRVADWLNARAEAEEERQMVREVSHDTGRPAAAVRAAMRRHAAP